MNPLIKLFAKKSNKSALYVEAKWLELEVLLIEQGMSKDDLRFSIYLTTLLKKKLKINESNHLLIRFKQFLVENQK